MLATVDIMKAYAKHFRDSTGTDTEKLLIMDNYYSHTDDDVKKLMRDANVLLDYIPSDTSDLIQVNGRGLGKIWKDKMSTLIENHMEENWDDWIGGGVKATERRVLLTKFAGDAWDDICRQQAVITRICCMWNAIKS
jgi:hypothetical protein